MKNISSGFRRLASKIAGTANVLPFQQDIESCPEIFKHPLSHQLSFALQEKIQLARAEINAKVGISGFDPRHFEIVPISITMPNLDPVFQGYRIAQISDIHLGQWMTIERLKGVIDLVNQQKPDLVVITGDFVSYIFDSFAEDLATMLRGLCPRDATVGILGNHDHWVGAQSVRAMMKESDVKDLSNDVFTLSRCGAELHIAGVDSIMVNQDRLDLVMKKMPPNGPAILLAHEPDFADVSAKTGRFSLQLSGHSHGGQFVIPGLGTPIRGYHFWKYPLGRYQVGDMIQYTNRGLGTNLFWSRINCPPEITVFVLETGD